MGNSICLNRVDVKDRLLKKKLTPQSRRNMNVKNRLLKKKRTLRPRRNMNQLIQGNETHILCNEKIVKLDNICSRTEPKSSESCILSNGDAKKL